MPKYTHADINAAQYFAQVAFEYFTDHELPLSAAAIMHISVMLEDLRPVDDDKSSHNTHLDDIVWEKPDALDD